MRFSAALRLLAPLLFVLAFAACSDRTRLDAAEVLPVDELYAEAHKSMTSGNYDRAVKYYKRLVARFPFGRYTEQAELDMASLEAAVSALAGARHIDVFATGITSWFMAQDLQARLFRLGLSANAWVDYHLQRVAAAAQSADGVVLAISHVGGLPSLLDAVDIARRQGAKVMSLTQPGTLLADRTDILLALSVPDDAVMHVGIDAYLTHLTVIEILTVLVAQRRGEPAVKRLQVVRAALQEHGVDVRSHPLQSWESGSPGKAHTDRGASE